MTQTLDLSTGWKTYRAPLAIPPHPGLRVEVGVSGVHAKTLRWEAAGQHGYVAHLLIFAIILQKE